MVKRKSYLLCCSNLDHRLNKDFPNSTLLSVRLSVLLVLPALDAETVCCCYISRLKTYKIYVLAMWSSIIALAGQPLVCLQKLGSYPEQKQEHTCNPRLVLHCSKNVVVFDPPK